MQVQAVFGVHCIELYYQQAVMFGIDQSLLMYKTEINLLHYTMLA